MKQYRDTIALPRTITSANRNRIKQKHHSERGQVIWNPRPLASASERGPRSQSKKAYGHGWYAAKRQVLPINQSALSSSQIHCQHSTQHPKQMKTPSSSPVDVSPTVPEPWQAVPHYSTSILSASTSAGPSAINVRKSSLAFSTTS